jgi:P4 family phage/plasmid primase-like protien
MAKFKPLKYTPKIIEKLCVRRLGQGTASQLFSYNADTGLYVPGDDLIRLEAQKRYGNGAKRHHINEIMESVRLNAPSIDPQDINDSKAEIVIFSNGVLCVCGFNSETPLNKKKLNNFSPNQNYTIGIPHQFKPRARCPNFNAFVGQILPKESHPLLKQIMGYLLIPSTKYRRFFIFVGKGANGKSTLIDVIIAMLGRKNVSHQSLHRIAENRFASAELYGKLANTYADLDSGDIKSTGLLKQIVAGDALDFEHKFKNPFSAPVTARLLFSANTIPAIREESKAIEDRLIILEFPNRFEASQQVKGLVDMLTKRNEMEGIITQWALPGLQSLLEKGEFDIPNRSKELQANYRKQTDPFIDFADQRIETVPEAFANRKELYNEYRSWCGNSGVTCISQRDFNRRIQQDYKLPDDDFRVPGTRERAWKGIQLKKEGVSQNDPK